MNNTTLNSRERFEKECDHIYEIYQLADTEIEKIYSFIEKEISEAEARGEARMKEKCVNALGEIQPEFFGDEYIKQKNVFIEEATKSISSL